MYRVIIVDEKFKYVKEPLNDEDIDTIDTWSNDKIRRTFKNYDCWEAQKIMEKPKENSSNDLVSFRKKKLHELNEQWKVEFENQKKHRKGCVEVKATNIQLPESKKINQIAGHIQTYKKVIYTNGIVWLYFDITNKKMLRKRV